MVISEKVITRFGSFLAGGVDVESDTNAGDFVLRAFIRLGFSETYLFYEDNEVKIAYK